MASLVSHPDEVRVVSKRFGKGATNIDRYLELDGYKAVQRALGMQPDAIIAEVKNWVSRTRRRRLLDRHEWSFVRSSRPSQNTSCATAMKANPALQRPPDLRA